jgi:hypothetical protein
MVRITAVVPNSVKNKAVEMMTNSYSQKGATVKVNELADSATRKQSEAAIQYMIKMGWVRQVTGRNEYTLTREGINEVEQSLNF